MIFDKYTNDDDPNYVVLLKGKRYIIKYAKGRNIKGFVIKRNLTYQQALDYIESIQP